MILLLPGFLPDAIGFATRTTLALLLAYLVAFWLQLDTASSAGLCVAIVAQPTPGMAMSKALYRIAGTLLGAVVAVGMMAAFPQDRTLLLAAFILWLGACTFVAALLRDFRSYGAVLCGYTVGIIAIGGIDAPGGVFDAAADRVAAILIGIVAVAFVNSLFGGQRAYDQLVAELRSQLDEITALAQRTLRTGVSPGDANCVARASRILALQTQASYAATELPDGVARGAGARSAIAALLAMISAARAIGVDLAAAGAPPAELRDVIDQAAEMLGGAGSADVRTRLAVPPASAQAAFLQDRLADLLDQHDLARAGLAALTGGPPVSRRVALLPHHDVVGAGLSAARTIIAVGLGTLFCIYGGWPGIAVLLIQQAAFTALLGMQPDPSRAGVGMAMALPLPAIAAGVVVFGLLPQASGFVPFALAVGPVMFVFALLARHPRLAAVGPGFTLYFTLLLSPSNQQTFDLSSYANNILIQFMAVLFMVLAFRLILPVSPSRRLARVAAAILLDLRRTLRRGSGLDLASASSRHFDRLAQAELWLRRRGAGRLALLTRMFGLAQLDMEMRRAWLGLDALRPSTPAQREAIATARASLLRPRERTLMAAAAGLVAQAGAPADPAVLRAASGLYGAEQLLAQQQRALAHYGVAAG